MTFSSSRAPADAATLRGILAMLASMACFTANDTCLKLASEALPLGQAIFLRNAFATLYIFAFATVAGGLSLPRDAPKRLIGLRLLGEVASTLLYLSALIAIPIADAIAIGQFTPLAVTAAAAVFLKEPVGWRRWLATVVGLVGVMLIIQPGSSAFSPASFLVLGSVAFVVVRDLATRRIASSVPTLTLIAMSAVTVTAAGLVLYPFETWQALALRETTLLMIGGAFLVGAYAFIVVAMRSGEIASVGPFRYSVILWALLAGYLVWNELPNRVAILGILIVSAAGLYTFHRERLRGALRAKPDR